jgi:membrane protease YdiL (CAAX protease family)
VSTPRAAVVTRDLWRPAVAASVVLVLYGNLSTIATWQGGAWPAVPAVGHPLLVALALAWAFGPARLSLDALGLGWHGWARGIPLGLGLGGVMALLVVLPMLGLRAVGWTSATAVPLPSESVALARHALFHILLATALCEELWFRGLLQACWVQVVGPTRGNVIQAGLFAVWHLAVWSWTLGQVTLQPPLPLALTVPAGLAILIVAGLLFGWLREVSGHLSGPIVAHWTIDVVLIALVGNWTSSNSPPCPSQLMMLAEAEFAPDFLEQARLDDVLVARLAQVGRLLLDAEVVRHGVARHLAADVLHLDHQGVGLGGDLLVDVEAAGDPVDRGGGVVAQQAVRLDRPADERFDLGGVVGDPRRGRGEQAEGVGDLLADVG